MKGFKLSTSSLTDLEKETTCPRRWQARWITKEIKPSEPTAPMLEGLYFESLCLGSSADGSTTYELPKLKNGEPSVKEQRILEQVERFKEITNPDHKDFCGLIVDDSQVYLEDGKTSGRLDIVGHFVEDGTLYPAISDLKFTGDIYASGGPYRWDAVADMDLIQIIQYSHLYEQNYGEQPRLFYLVFDASPKKNIKLIEVVLTDYKKNERNIRFDTASSIIREYSGRDTYPTKPLLEECKTCPLKCDKRYQEIPEVVKVKLVY